MQFSFSSWSKKYAKWTFKSVIINLDIPFIQYLAYDKILLPTDNIKSELSSSSSHASQFSENEEEELIQFPQLQVSVENAILKLGGKVLPKLNWSGPKDSVWISPTSNMMCDSFNSILLLLKSSDFINYDLERGANQLVLKQWYDLDKSLEFRVFVKNYRIVGVSQRDIFNYYVFLDEVLVENEFMKLISEFHDVIPEFSASCYTFDIYIEKSNRVILIDFNNWGEATDGLLYDWQEFDEELHCEIRLIESQSDSRIINEVAYSNNRLPKDMFDLGNGLTHDELIDAFRKVCHDNVLQDDMEK
jgi:hypothetical protein